MNQKEKQDEVFEVEVGFADDFCLCGEVDYYYGVVDLGEEGENEEG